MLALTVKGQVQNPSLREVDCGPFSAESLMQLRACTTSNESGRSFTVGTRFVAVTKDGFPPRIVVRGDVPSRE